MWYRPNCTVIAMRKLRIPYNTIQFTEITEHPKHNSVREVLVNLNIKSFGELIRNNIHSFMNRLGLQCSKNLRLSSICKSTTHLYSNIWSWWFDILIL